MSKVDPPIGHDVQPGAGGNDRIVIIGCGYVGLALGAEWRRRGCDLIGTTTSPDRCATIKAAGITPAIVSLGDHDGLCRVITGCDVVYLTAAAGRDRNNYRAVYEEGVRNLLTAARRAAVRQIVYTSSTRVYGQDDGSWVDETSPTEPRDDRGRILLEAERTLLAESLDPDSPIIATILRLSGIHGPDRELAHRIRAAAGTRRDDGNGFVNLVHRDDIVRALVRLREVAYSGTLNLSDDHPTTRRELYDRELSAAGLAPIHWQETADAPRGKRVRNDLIKATLGMTLTHPTH